MSADPLASQVVWRFGVFELDLRTGELRKDGTRVKLHGQPWEVLIALLENAGGIVTRQQLRDRLWPTDTFVDFDHSLNIAINKIRDALGDDRSNPRFIQTVPRRGYRFIAPVERLVVGQPGQSVASNRPRWARFTGLRAGGAAVLSVALIAIAARAITSSRPARYAIAVLPLRNESAGPDAENLSDGLTDQIIYDLSTIDGLEVKSATSSFQFKNTSIDLREAGRQLQADLILEGAFLKAAGRLRLTIALMRVADGVTLWSQRYEQNIGDLAQIQDEISRAIVNQLRLKGVGGRRRYSTDPNTYELYLRALSLSNENAPGNAPRLRRAVDLLQQVTSQDPSFAPAFATLAQDWAHMGNRGRSRESVQQMRAAVEQAIALDPLLPQAQAVVGLVRARDLRWQEAEAAFRRALELDPNLAAVRGDFAIYVLLPEGKVVDALAQIRRAIDVDPLSVTPRSQLAFVHLRAGDYDQALRISQAILAANPDSGIVLQLSARALLLTHKYDEALTILEKLGPPSHGYLGYAYAMVGRRREAEALAAEDDPAAARHQVLIYAALGDRERCFDALRRLAEADDVMADLYPGEPELISLRDDPRMRAFLHQRGLPVDFSRAAEPIRSGTQ